MMAAVLTRIPTDVLEVKGVPDPVPAVDEVLVKVSACGICGTDLHLMKGEAYRPQLPFVLGHEPVGVVVSAAPEAEHDEIDALVVPTLFTGCGECLPCLSGDERLCLRSADVLGVLGRQGAFAEYLAVPRNQLVPVPHTLSVSVAASLVDCGPTARNAFRVALEGRHYGERYHLVIGGGPVGFLVASLMAAAGQRFIAVETNPLRARELSRCGFEVVGCLPEGQQQFTTVVDCVGSASLFAQALPLLAAHGRYICVGYATVPEADLPTVSHRELDISGIRSGSRADLEAVLSMVAAGEVQAPPVETWDLAHINDALSALQAGEVVGKAVILTDGTSSETVRHAFK